MPALAGPAHDDIIAADTVDLTVYATGRHAKAHGPDRGPSYLTQAILAGLSGACARRYRARWWVSTGELAGHLDQLMRLAGAPDDQVPVTRNRNSVRLRKVAEPTATLHLGCDPAAANASADLSWHRAGLESRFREHRSPRAWVVNDVPAGACQFRAEFPDGEYKSTDVASFIHPPLTDECIEVAAW